MEEKKKTFAGAMQLSYALEKKDEEYVTPNIEHLLEFEDSIDGIIDAKLSDAMANISMSQLTLDGLEEVNPRSLTLTQQDSLKIAAEYNGDMVYVKASGLDYSRIRIATQESDEGAAREGDFIFSRL